MNHPDFRVDGKIFATVGYPDKSRGMVKLTPVEQSIFIQEEPDVFSPCAGAWGRGGSTSVNLKLAKKATIRRALRAAWELASTTLPSTPRAKEAIRKKSRRKS